VNVYSLKTPISSLSEECSESETRVIRSGLELEQALPETIRKIKISGLDLELLPLPHDFRREEGDFLLRTEADGITRSFIVECKIKASAIDVDRLRAAPKSSSYAPLLATVNLSEHLARHCERAGLSCIDLNGRWILRHNGLFVNVHFHPATRFRLSEPEPDLFSPISSRVARVLLSFPDRKWKQQELVDITKCSSGLVSRLLNEYLRLGWVEGPRTHWVLVKPDGLLDAWADADDWKKRGVLRQYSWLGQGKDALARRLYARLALSPDDPTEGAAAAALAGNIPVFTQWFAAQLRFPYAELEIVSAYVRELPHAEVIKDLGLREVSNGGALWLIVPRDHGVFQATQTVNGFELVCDAQIYLDLLKVGFRGPDQAEALRQWEGFRR
jgi:hypothetical protein